jgi:hypothetical protein
MTVTLQNIAAKVNGFLLSKKMLSHLPANTKRVICTINNIDFHCAIMNSKLLGNYIMLSAKTMKQLGLNLGDTITPVLKQDNTDLQFLESKILDAVLETDELGKQKFNELTNGKKRAIISLVHQVKNEAKQIDRALKIVSNLKKGIVNPKYFLQ